MATLTAIFTAQDNLSKAMQKAGSAGSKTSGIMQKLGKIGSVAMKGIIAAVTAAATALLALGKNAVAAGMSFESSMSQVMATMGINQSTAEGKKAYETLTSAAEKMGAETAFSATQAADALNYLALAGYSADQAAEALPTVLYLAGAGAMDLAAASDLVTDAMAALQMEVNQTNLNKFADELAKTASTTNTSVAQLGEAILTVGATAANLANGTTELNTQLGILANVGIKGAEAGTHLRNILLRLQNPTEKAAKALNKLGVSVYDSNGNMRDTGEIFNDLKNAMAGMSQQEIDQIMSTIFNKTDLAAAQALLAGAGDEYERIFNILKNSGGAAAEMYMTMLNNLKGDVDMFKSATEALYLSLYKSINGTLRNLVQTGTSYMQRLNEAFKTGGFEGLATELGNVLGDAIGVIMSYVPKVIEAGTGVVIAFVDSIGNNADLIAEAAVEIAVHLAEAIIKIAPKLAVAFAKMLGAAAKALIGAIPDILRKVPDSIYKAFGLDKATVMTNVMRFTRNMRAALSKAFSGDFAGAIDRIGTAFNLDEGQINRIKNVVSKLADAFDKVKNAAMDVARAVAQFIAKFASIGGIEAIVAGLAAAFIAIKAINVAQTIIGIVNAVKTLGASMAALMATNPVGWVAAIIGALVALGVLLYKNWDKVSAAAKKVGAAIKKAFENIGKKMSKWFGDVKTWASEKWDSFKEAWANGKVGDWMKQQVNGLGQKMKTWFGDVKNWATQKWNDLKNAWNGSKVGQWFNNTFKGIGQKLGEWFGPVGNWAAEKWGQIKDAWNGSKVGQWFNEQFSGIGAKLGEWFGPIGSWAKDKWEEIKTAWNNGTIGDWFAEQFTGIGAKLGEWFGPASEWASTKWNEIKTAWNNSNVGQWFNTQFSGIGAKLGEWFGPAAEWASTKWEEIKTAWNNGTIGDWFSEQFTGLGAKLGEWFGDVASWAGEKWEAIKSAFNNGDPLGFFSDAFSGIGEKFGEWFGSVQTALEPLQPVFESIASTFKSTFDKLKESIEPIKESFEEIKTKLSELWTKITQGGDNGAPSALEAIGTALLTIGKAVLVVFGAIATVVIGAVNGIINALAPLIQAFTSVFGAIIDVVTAVVQVITGDFKGAWASIKSALTGVWNGVKSIGEAIGNFFKGIWDAVSGIIGAIGGAFTAVGEFIRGVWEGIVTGLIGFINGAIDVINGMTATLSKAWSWTGIIPEIPEIPPIEIPVKFKKEEGDGLSPDVANGIDVPVGADTSQFDAAMNGLENSTAGTTVPAPELDMSKWDAAVNENLAALTNAAQGTELDFGEPDTSGLDEAEKAAEDVKAKLDALGDITLPDTSGMSGDLDSLNNAITDAESNIKNLETTFSGLDLTSAGTNAGNTFTAGLQGADPTGAASELAASVSSSVESKVGGAFTTAGTNAANQFGTSLQTTAAGITLNAEGATIAGTLTEGMNEGMPAAVESMTTTGEQIRAAAQAVNLSAQGRHMLQTLTQGMNSGRGAAVASARATGNAIRSAFASINLYSTGVNIMRGLLNGMKSMFNTLMAEAKRMAAELKKTIQSGMEVASPSKFTTWVGEMTGQGLINGIENMTAKAAAAAANMTAGMRDAMAPTNNAATPRAASQSPYDALGGNGGENRNNSSEGNSGERRIVIDVTGSGQIEVTGMTRESAAEMIANQIKPKLMEILSREIYTGGVGTYEY